MLGGLFRAYIGWAARQPFVSQVVVATGKTVAADVLVQTVVEKKKKLDVRRVGIFASFGFLYLGCIQYAIYVKGMQNLFSKVALNRFCNASFRDKIRDRQGLKILAGTVAIDFFAIQPFLYWPAYYWVKEVGYDSGVAVSVSKDKEKANQEAEEVNKTSILLKALGKYKDNFWQDNLGMCGFWLPADLIIYSVPLHMRLHLNHGISFAWVALVSIFRGGSNVVASDDGGTYDSVCQKKLI